MRVCRFQSIADGKTQLGFYDESGVIPWRVAVDAYRVTTGQALDLPIPSAFTSGDSPELLDLLPPAGAAYPAARRVAQWLSSLSLTERQSLEIPPAAAQLLVPIPRPNKLFLLAGNYAEHIREGGDVAAERAETFPYVFMKPPTTTLTDPGRPIRIPAISPAAIDWELELAVIIGRRCRGVKESEALDYVAGYTVINDISDRRFRPNPQRKKRDRDAFFDWLHGKWHDSFCPCGPCVLSADALADPQQLSLQLKLNGRIQQDASTSQMIFPVAAVIEFIASFVTLEPGDIISTGTPAGVGNTTGTYVRAGDQLEATIQSIGTLHSPVTA